MNIEQGNMLDKNHFERISKALPFLQTATPQIKRDFTDFAYYAKIPAGRQIFAEGDEVDGIALLMSGVVRVYKLGQSGREITLYRFGEGESCVITANAILHQQDFPAIALIEQDAEAVMIPAEIFIDWVRRYDPWRDFVFNLVSERLANVMEIVDEVAFQRMDHRVASFLIERSQMQNPIRITHQEIANEIGSSREVISRLLEDFAQREMVNLSRGEIKILDFEGLKVYSTL
ncbi:Crp/Fnr family transcriptional regulator [Chloroflexota bacterium]